MITMNDCMIIILWIEDILYCDYGCFSERSKKQLPPIFGIKLFVSLPGQSGGHCASKIKSLSQRASTVF